MPNHRHNRVTVYAPTMGAEARSHVAKIKQIFEDENCFGQIIPEPDWANTPLLSSHNNSITMPSSMKYGNDGEVVQCFVHQPSWMSLALGRAYWFADMFAELTV